MKSVESNIAVLLSEKTRISPPRVKDVIITHPAFLAGTTNITSIFRLLKLFAIALTMVARSLGQTEMEDRWNRQTDKQVQTDGKTNTDGKMTDSQTTDGFHTDRRTDNSGK